MDLLTLLFRLPLMPLQGFIRLGEVLRDQAEHELHDPASVRRQLEEAEEAHATGELSEDELAHVQGRAVDRLLPSPAQPSARTRAHREGADLDG